VDARLLLRAALSTPLEVHELVSERLISLTPPEAPVDDHDGVAVLPQSAQGVAGAGW
jgi:hypothetical protein